MSAAVLYARHLNRQVEFFAALGLTVDEIEPDDYAILVGDGLELSIVQIPEAIASQIEITTPPVIRASAPLKLAIDVESLDVAVKSVLDRGGLAPEQNRSWEFRSKIVRDVVDLEGNVIQLRAPATG